jgi:hypothetical protein
VSPNDQCNCGHARDQHVYPEVCPLGVCRKCACENFETTKQIGYREMREWIDRKLGGWSLHDHVRHLDTNVVYQVEGLIYDEHFDEWVAVLHPGTTDFNGELVLMHFSKVTRA